MRFVPNKKSLPRTWLKHPGAQGLLAETDIRVTPRGRLAAKVLIFKNPTSLQRFWKQINDVPLGRECRGAVNALGTTVEDHRKNGDVVPIEMRGDPRYFCIVGLCVGWLGMEVVTHESVHAAFCYEKRVRRNMFGTAAADHDEERICYPAGAIGAGIVRFLNRAGFYD